MMHYHNFHMIALNSRLDIMMMAITILTSIPHPNQVLAGILLLRDAVYDFALKEICDSQILWQAAQ